MNFNRWITKELHRGDLSALSNLAKGRPERPTPGQIARLSARGFLKKKVNDVLKITVKGHVTLWIRRRASAK